MISKKDGTFESKCLNWDGKWERERVDMCQNKPWLYKKCLMERHRFVQHLLRIQIKDLNVCSLNG